MVTPHFRRRHLGRGGIGLVDVVVACAVIGAIAAGGAQLGMAHDAAVRASHAEHLALRAALAALDDTTGFDEGTTTFAPAKPDASSVPLAGRRTVRRIASNLAEVTVVVTYGDATVAESVTLTRRVAFEERPR